MQWKPLEPKGKLGAMAGYSWSAPAVDMGAVSVNGPEGQARDHDLAGWDAIDWRAGGGGGRRGREEGFQGARGSGWVGAADPSGRMAWGRAPTRWGGRGGAGRHAGGGAPRGGGGG